ncbi:MAG: outer membrane protein assembly factor BamA [Bacteroidales bacterium]|nr:outer membrane protein assembly factor BamA [Bacteroidales bacterium]MBN2697311.1 outer membrane protein assembly factor BamA [Bacteroidales bacterium]
MTEFKAQIILLLCLSFQITAQELSYDSIPVMDYSVPKELVIADIRVSGIEFIQKEVLISLSGLKEGKTIMVPGDDITNVLKKFWSQGLFSDAKISAYKITRDSIWIDIYLKEQPRMSSLNIEGIGKSESQDVMEKINLRNGQQVTDDIINNTRRIIREHFIEKGFLNTDVVITMKDDSVRVNMVELNIDVHKNDRIKIEEIYFTGNNSFKEQVLRRKMKNTKKVNINFFKASKLVSDDFSEDKAKLIAFYNENGYRDAKILSDSIAFIAENRINLYITIEEGNKYYFGDIEWIGNTKYPSELLSAVLGIEKGDIFDQSILDERLFIDEDAVNSVYLDNGYLFFDLTPIEVSVEDDTIDFEMRIYEGKKATINEVIIKGNTRTNEHVVRRELRTRPGDLFSKQELIRTVRELANLGHFDPEQIAPNPIPNPADGTVDLEYKLVERATDQLEVSGGYGAGMLVGTIGIRFSNFAARRLFDPKAWRPVPSGDGQTLSIRAQTNGRYYQSYNFSFVEPWFGGKKPNSFSVSVYYSKINPNYYSYYNYWTGGDVPDEHMKIFGASLGLGRRLSWPDDFFTLYNSITYQRYKMKDYTGFLAENGTFNNFSFTATLGRNSQDQIIYPRRGSNLSLSLQITPPYSRFNQKFDYLNAPEEEKYRWVEYHRWMFKADWYYTIFENLVLMTRMHFGWLGHYNDDIGPSPFEGFDLGGDGLSGYNLYGRETIAQRGYPNSSLTPTVNGKKSGNVYTKYTLELRYPISLNPSATVFGLAFLEAGNAWYSIDEFNPFSAKRAAGVGVRAFLPMFGLLGIDWGWGFDSYPGSSGPSGSQFHFTIGQQF